MWASCMGEHVNEDCNLFCGLPFSSIKQCRGRNPVAGSHQRQHGVAGRGERPLSGEPPTLPNEFT